jgi:hypothetical protein
MEISSETRPLSKRVRTDTFWKCSEKDNSEYFGKILDGEHDIYYVDQEADVNLDYRQTKRHCWQLRNKATGNYVPAIRSTETYRLSLLWSLSAGFWQRESKKQRVATAIPTLRTKRGKHSRHRCPNSWCCNPGHILIGSRVDNEIDKHFHYFLKSEDYGILFMDTFRRACKKQKVWGKYPPD